MSLSQDITNLVTATNNLTNTVNNKIADIDNHVNTAINNVVNAKAVTYHVDALNGNDNNDGSPGSPFQTIKKALNSVPVGGDGRIILAQNQTHYIDGNTVLANKRIVIVNNNSVIENTPYKYTDNGSEYTSAYGMFLFFSEVTVLNGTIRTANLLTDVNGNVLPEYFNSGFIRRQDETHGFVKAYRVNIELGDTNFIRRSVGGGSVDLYMFNGSIDRIGQNANGFLIYNEGNGDFRFSAPGVTLGTENDGATALSWSSLVQGVIKDTNGVPRNIISNIVF